MSGQRLACMPVHNNLSEDGMAIKALFAVWGALANGNPNEAQAADVGGRLQQLFNEGVTTVTINDNNFGDP
jgi:hypothetical protein